ncbi:MAG: hydroxyacylglutathione hydrolase [Pseudomonadota bacterium]
MRHLEIHQFPCLNDNYGVLLHDPENNLTATIDAPEASVIISALAAKNWTLTHILNTHHHFDHTGGNEALKAQTNCTIVGPAGEADKIPGIDQPLKEGDNFQFGNATAAILETPGHTAGHISYWFEQETVLFVGDTLFAMGCGRLFEGDAQTMWSSLQKIIALPKETVIYCGHEYTMSNAEFALALEPGNDVLQERVKHVKNLRAKEKPTLPTTLEQELATNPFLRTGNHNIQKRLGMVGQPEWEIFREIRHRKDNA